MRTNAVFEGGGVKAIALVGSVSSAETRGVQFHQVAGTSSGAIVAAFIAAGYSAAEMRHMIMETPFTSFLKRSGIYRTKFIGSALRLLVKKGLYSGEVLEYWIAQKLRDKGIRTFADLEPKKLRIIASDISRGRLLVLPDDIAQYGMDPLKLDVAKAVRMSASLPYFFDPVILRKPFSSTDASDPFPAQFIYIVDGGLLSNFPLWIFDQEMTAGAKQRSNNKVERVPTIGFQLVGKHLNVPRSIFGPISMFQALFATMMDAHDERYIEKHNLFRTVKIPTLGVQTTQFNISKEMSMKLFESGVQAADEFFDKWTISGYLDKYEKLVL